MNDLCDEKTRKKCNSFYKEAFLNRSEYIKQLNEEIDNLKQRNELAIEFLKQFLSIPFRPKIFKKYIRR